MIVTLDQKHMIKYPLFYIIIPQKPWWIQESTPLLKIPYTWDILWENLPSQVVLISELYWFFFSLLSKLRTSVAGNDVGNEMREKSSPALIFKLRIFSLNLNISEFFLRTVTYICNYGRMLTFEKSLCNQLPDESLQSPIHTLESNCKVAYSKFHISLTIILVLEKLLKRRFQAKVIILNIKELVE